MSTSLGQNEESTGSDTYKWQRQRAAVPEVHDGLGFGEAGVRQPGLLYKQPASFWT